MPLYATPIPSTAISDTVETILADATLRSATKFLSPKLVVTATRRGRADKRDTRVQIVLTIGKPNFRGRAFVKACLAAGEPFPVKKVQLRWRRKGKRAAARRA